MSEQSNGGPTVEAGHGNIGNGAPVAPQPALTARTWVKFEEEPPAGANGDIIVTLLPVNTQCPWITPAQFRPELVPEELMAQGLTVSISNPCHIFEPFQS
ncbi:unnamed protein product [Acanthoscelides obtectus]|uniref:Uncharacterized protein n=1 Tax=Acanthoscelides obtectus TaxID=200917 RepID=A0A9P0MJK6_ACAOB|nr:unnamed protein product [Acanthoscelides obtectus]CAK1684582.1 hypothetical protein AOBTE_LOCUS34946 [Acanthoscelides obtectus]